MENLRKVKFTLGKQVDLGLLDHGSEEEREKTTKERDRWFHAWGNECIWNAEGKFVEQVIGVVEEAETGKVYHVIPKRMYFVI